MRTRKAGILLPLAALPGRGAIGDLGPGARRFLAFLEAAGQRVWQMLPVGTTAEADGNSPYSSRNALEIDPLFLSLEDLVEDGLLRAKDLPARRSGGGRIRYQHARAEKLPLLGKASEAAGVEVQELVRRQWARLRDEAARRGIELWGDLPLYVAKDSDDVLEHPELFADEVAGVPPDYFSATGQLWGMPTYRWKAHAAEGYRWWRARVDHLLGLFDRVRIDHFRGLQAYWAVPPEAATAASGLWVAGPGRRLLDALLEGRDALPFVAEDLGVIDPSVTRLRQAFGLPGMRVLQFAFSGDEDAEIHLPHALGPDTVLFTGTHDNNTTRGWYEQETDVATRRRLAAYLGRRVTADRVAGHLMRLAYATVATDVVVPLQDVFGLGAAARTNTPGKAAGSWRWRAGMRMLGKEPARVLRTLAETYGRA